MDITQDELRARLSYDSSTGILSWKRKDADNGGRYWRRWNARYAGHEAGSVMRIKVRNTIKHYRRLHLNGKDVLAHRAIWCLVTGEWPKGEIDHRDGDSLNNRWSNLRCGTHSQNAVNVSARSNTGYRGVSRTRQGLYYAQLKKGGKHVLAKAFRTAEEAARAYDIAAIQHFGEFARPNFPLGVA